MKNLLPDKIGVVKCESMKEIRQIRKRRLINLVQKFEEYGYIVDYIKTLETMNNLHNAILRIGRRTSFNVLSAIAVYLNTDITQSEVCNICDVTTAGCRSVWNIVSKYYNINKTLGNLK